MRISILVQLQKKTVFWDIMPLLLAMKHILSENSYKNHWIVLKWKILNGVMDLSRKITMIPIYTLHVRWKQMIIQFVINSRAKRVLSLISSSNEATFLYRTLNRKFVWLQPKLQRIYFCFLLLFLVKLNISAFLVSRCGKFILKIFNCKSIVI